MSNPKEQLDALKDIRNMMERSSRFISLSGLSGVLIGAIALAGVTALCLYFQFSPLDKGYYTLVQNNEGVIDQRALQVIIATVLIVLLLAIGSGIIMTIQKSRKLEVAAWDSSSKRMLINMLIPLVTGGAFCLILLENHLFPLLAPVTLIFYGLALVNASKYTIEDIRYLGMIEILLGLSSAWWIDLGLINWAMGFGVLHILYGIFLYSKHEK